MTHHTITTEKVLDWQRRLREAQAIVAPAMQEMEDAYRGGLDIVEAVKVQSDHYQNAVRDVADYVRTAARALDWLASDEDISPFTTLLKRVAHLGGEA